jgi:hypothetical protein
MLHGLILRRQKVLQATSKAVHCYHVAVAIVLLPAQTLMLMVKVDALKQGGTAL